MTKNTGHRSSSRIVRSLLITPVLALGLAATTSAPASAAVSRDNIVSIAMGEKNNSSRNVEDSADCNFYTGYMRNWKPAAGCSSTDGVQWRSSDWCSDFAEYVWMTAGVTGAGRGDDNDIDGWASSFKDYGGKHGTWHAAGSDYIPKPGDAIIFDWPDNGPGIDHVGLVTSATSSTVYTVEGNVGPPDSRTVIVTRSHSRSSSAIVGFTEPVGAQRGAAGSDLDGDGVGDVFSTATGQLTIWNGNGANSFRGSAALGTGWGQYSRPVAGDFNGDGKSDLAAVKDDKLTLWHGTGPNSFAAAPALPGIGWNKFASTLMSPGDLNRDGHADLAATFNDQLWLWNGDGQGSFGAAFSLPGTGWAPYTRPVGGDFNGDGIGDFAGIKDDKLTFWYGNGSNSIASVNPLPGTGWNKYAATLIAPGDLNRDGRDDLAGVYNDKITIWNPTATGIGATTPLPGTGWGAYFPG
ncbi:FG-GAP-like repeat-containing protein [Nonomuraea sp. NPDC050310]|uniref:FG-GAP-like repeat-containing protein n=1 Tax=Nonomuraea sp. NPDC050310 TaxID=3154935 RepID=UPI0033C3D23C